MVRVNEVWRWCDNLIISMSRKCILSTFSMTMIDCIAATTYLAVDIQSDAIPDSKVYGANMGPTWGRQDPGGPHGGLMNLAIWHYGQLWHNIWMMSHEPWGISLHWILNCLSKSLFKLSANKSLKLWIAHPLSREYMGGGIPANGYIKWKMFLCQHSIRDCGMILHITCWLQR